jgi:hypothetical protein
MAGDNISDQPANPITDHEAQHVLAHTRATDADRELHDIITGAYNTATNARSRLQRISDEIEQRAAAAETTTDTPTGTAEFHKFLVSKQKDIINILTDSAADAATRRQRLAELTYPATIGQTP